MSKGIILKAILEGKASVKYANKANVKRTPGEVTYLAHK
jgi:hypothetical protein